MNPMNNKTYNVLRDLIKEVAHVFPDKYVHLGGDEVNFTCWKSNPEINDFMSDMDFGKDFDKLEQYYVQNLLDIVKETSPSTGYMIWQEVIDNNVIVNIFIRSII
jgi:hexosaminidase